MLMSEVGTCFQVDPNYRVLLPPEDYLILVAGAEYGTAGGNFTHPNVMARKFCVHEFKHSMHNGGKFWTQKPGVEFFFVIPKDRIELIQDKGYSYVPVLIGGQKFHLNVSGGTGANNGWTDLVHQRCHTCVGLNVKTLKILAEVSLPVAECRAKDITFDLHDTNREQANFRRLAAAKEIDLRPGCKVVGENGETYTLESKGHRIMVKDSGGARWRIKRTQIDWLKTIAANSDITILHRGFNALGRIIMDDNAEAAAALLGN